MSLSNGMEEYYQKVIQLQERLRQSEEERLKLEMKFNEMLQMMKEEEEAHFKKLRTKYKQFLEDDRRRQQRNDKILEALDRIENRTVMWEAKTEKFKNFRKRYNDYLKHAGGLSRSRSPLDAEPLPDYKPKVQEPIPERTTLYSEKDPKSDSADPKNDIVEKYLQSLSSSKCKEDILQRRSDKPSPESKYSNLGNINSVYWKTPNTSEKTDPEKTHQFSSTQLKTNKDLENSLKQNGTASAPLFKKYDYSEFGRNGGLDSYDNDYGFDKQPPTDVFQKELESDPLKNSYASNNQPRFDYATSEATTKYSKLQSESSLQAQDPEQVHHNLERLLRQHKDETNSFQNQPLEKASDQLQPQQSFDNIQLKQEQFKSLPKSTTPLPPVGDEYETVKQTLLEKQLPIQTGESKDAEIHNIRQPTANAQNISNNSSPRLSQARLPGSPYHQSKTQSPIHQTKPESPYHQSKPQSPYHQSKPQSPYHQSKPQSPYHQSKPGSPYHQSNTGSPYHQPTSESPYQQPQSESPYHQPAPGNVQYHANPGSPYRQSKPGSPYHQPQQHSPIQMQNVAQPIENNDPGQQMNANEMQPQFETTYAQPVQQPVYFQQPPKFRSFMMRWKNRAAQPSQQQYVSQQLPQNQINVVEQPLPQQYIGSEQPVEQNYGVAEQSLQQYDANGQPIQPYDGSEQYAQQYYDENGQPVQQYTEPTQPPQQYYDESGQPLQNYSEADQPQPQPEYYDQTEQQYYQNAGQIQYDENGQPITQYDENGQPFPQYDQNAQPQYDANGQPLPQYDENGQLIPQYDANGQLITQYDANGQPLQQYYDENGQPIQYYGDGQSAQQYDENGQPIQQQYSDQPYGDQQQYYKQEDVGQQQQNAGQQPEQSQAESKPKVLDILDTDTESAKQDTKTTNDSDFDFSNG